ncbi:MAG: PASTA domain-containing protein [Stackebrandtia sp.]
MGHKGIASKSRYRLRVRALLTGIPLAMAFCATVSCSAAGEPASSSPGESETQSGVEQTEESKAAGEEPADIEMPSVVGENAAVAKDELEGLGFTKIELGSVDPDNDSLGVINPSNWTVEDQSHNKGDKLAPDAVIVLGCIKNT